MMRRRDFLAMLGTQAVSLSMLNMGCSPSDNPNPNPEMKVTFLGNTTLHITDGDTSILIDGFMSRNPLAEALFPAGEENKCKVRPSRIYNYLRQGKITDVDVIVVGHSHYDHALDFAYIAENIFPRAKVFGSRSTRMIGTGAGLGENRFYPDVDNRTAYLRIGRFTIKMIPSVHGNPWLYRGEIESPEPFRHLNDPQTGAVSSELKDGGVYTIIVSHKARNGETRSALIQDTAGYSPDLPPLSDQVDAVFMTVTGLGTPEQNDRENNYRNLVENTGARLVIPVHWDNFFADLNDILNDPAIDPYIFSDNMPVALNWTLERTKASSTGASFYQMKFFETIDLYQGIEAADPSRVNALWIIK